MKNDAKEKITRAAQNSCANTDTRSLWTVGIAVVALATLFCFAIFKTRQNTAPLQSPAQGVTASEATPPGRGGLMQYLPVVTPRASGDPQGRPLTVLPGGLQAALPGANCFTCPSFTQCFPQGAGTGGAQQVALPNPNCFTCPSFTQCFPQGAGTGGAQQVALPNPNCFTCPSFTQCFPQGAGTGGAQQVALPNPNYFGASPFAFQGQGGLTNVALTQAVAAPNIFRDAVMPHEYRGVCENCHVIMPDIAIPATAQMPHVYRGVCSNCHTILGMNAGAGK